MVEPSDATKAILRELKAAAAARRLVTYGELARAAGGIIPRSVGAHLTVIHARLRERSAGLPWLVAIAVNVDTRVPDKGAFRGEGIVLDMSDPNQAAWWEAMTEAVYAADWSGIEL